MDLVAEPGPHESAPGVELATYLWEEYKYRHDLVWRLLFRITAVAAILSIAPLSIAESVREKMGLWVASLPALAVLLVAGGIAIIMFELRLFLPINQLYC